MNTQTSQVLTYMGEQTTVQACNVCSCTNDAPCYHEKLGMCWWVKADLCSHCAMIQAGELPAGSVTHCVNSNPIIP